jgi:3-oxoacyl-[acyl-carrier-protein] synthase-1
MAIAGTLPPECLGAERLALLTRRAWSELQPALAALPGGTRLGVHVGVSERIGRAAAKPFASHARALETELRSLAEPFSPASMALYPHGHAAFAFALKEALAALAGRTIDAAIVGGVDTAYDKDVVDALVAEERLFDQENIDSIIPGEGASLLLLLGPEGQRLARLPSLAQVENVATALEEATLLGDKPSIGRGLSAAMHSIAKALKAERRQLHWLLMDVTNESYRTHEYGLAVSRALAPGGLAGGRDYFEVAPPRLLQDFLPENFGDLGAATMATAAVLAVQAFQRGAPATKNCMLTGSSVTRERGAVLLSAPG